MKHHPIKPIAIVLVYLCIQFSVGGAESKSLVLLHTNDIHDHVLPSKTGVGGLPYVSGYIKDVKSTNPSNTLVLDAGDVGEKGDMVAFIDDSKITYKMLGQIGFDAGVPGNHEHDAYGTAALFEFETMARGMDMLCLNLLKENGEPRFQPSKIYTINGIRVGVIALIVPRKTLCLDLEASGVALSKEAAKLKGQTDLLVALCHLGSEDCKKLSIAAPEVDLFVSGHHHEILLQPLTVESTDALIVQAGYYAKYVGRMDLEIDPEVGGIQSFRYELVEMDQKTIPVDSEMLDWVLAEEKRLCPVASKRVGYADKEVSREEVAWLAATAMKEYGQSDIAFCQARKIIRATIPEGAINVNTVFLTGGNRAYDLYELNLTGAQINAYLNGIYREHEVKAQWSGFGADFSKDAVDGVFYTTDLDPDQFFSVIVPKKEWESQFVPMVPHADSVEIREADFTFTDAVVGYLEQHAFDDEKSLQAHIHNRLKP